MNPAGTERDVQPVRKPTVWRAERRFRARDACAVGLGGLAQIVLFGAQPVLALAGVRRPAPYNLAASLCALLRDGRAERSGLESPA